MINTADKEHCCGCWACNNVCPVAAITMQSDAEGFMYPSINEKKCIHCNKCESVCPFGENNPLIKPQKVYAVKNLDEHVRENSSSGGFFSVLMDYTINNGGVVYGAKFDKEFNVLHGRAETKDDCKHFRGAKYVQSQLGNIHRRVKDDLKQNRIVLFSGTPCQISSLKKYLGKLAEDEKFITCDILCHGVPSPLIWRDYLGLLGKKIASVSFRSKRNGWHSTELKIADNENVLVSENHRANAYSQLYFCHYSLRPSCANCPYASIERSGDFSIGDFWGIEKTHPEFDDNKGVSLLFVNTIKANQIFHAIQGTVISKESSLEKCMQPVLRHPSKLAVNRADFWKDYWKKGLLHSILMYTYKGDQVWYIRLERKWNSIKKKILKTVRKYDTN